MYLYSQADRVTVHTTYIHTCIYTEKLPPPQMELIIDYLHMHGLMELAGSTDYLIYIAKTNFIFFAGLVFVCYHLIFKFYYIPL